MHTKPDDLYRVSRGLSHELSNVLTYLLPALSDSGQIIEILRGLVRDGSEAGTAAAVGLLRREFSLADLERLDRQLQLGGQRISLMFRDLKVAYQPPGPLGPVDLWTGLCQVLPETGGAPTIELCGP